MKALSIQQPWAWLIANGFIDVENRDWNTKFRGKFLIHAGKKIDQESYENIKADYDDIPLPPIHKLDIGGIVGIAEITNSVTESESEWFIGDYGFLIDKAYPLEFRPLKGQLGFFEVDINKLGYKELVE